MNFLLVNDSLGPTLINTAFIQHVQLDGDTQCITVSTQETNFDETFDSVPQAERRFAEIKAALQRQDND